MQHPSLLSFPPSCTCLFHRRGLEQYQVHVRISTNTMFYIHLHVRKFSNGVCTSSPTYSCTVWNYTNSYHYCLNSYFLAVLIVWPSMNRYRCYGKIRIEPVPRWIRIFHTYSSYVRINNVILAPSLLELCSTYSYSYINFVMLVHTYPRTYAGTTSKSTNSYHYSAYSYFFGTNCMCVMISWYTIFLHRHYLAIVLPKWKTRHIIEPFLY